MRTSLRIVVSLAGWLLVVLCLTGCQRPQEPTEPYPPFAAPLYADVDDALYVSALWGAYETNPAQAEKQYNGKILKVLEMGFLPWSKAVLQDGNGRKYFSIISQPPGKPNEERELVRCYLYRPENPIVEDEGGGGGSFGVKGVCKGMRGGVIILEKCTVFTYVELPGRW